MFEGVPAYRMEFGAIGEKACNSGRASKPVDDASG
jgi:hypothetical protein